MIIHIITYTKHAHTHKLQINPCIENYYFIIIINYRFSRPYISIYDIFIQKKTSFNARATHFNISIVHFLNPLQG